MQTLTAAIQEAYASVTSLQLDPTFQERIAAERASATRELDMQKQRRWRFWVGRIAPVRAARTVWNAAETPAVKAVRDWFARGATQHLVLRGGVGCGKTTAACTAVQRWCEPDAASLSSGAEERAPAVSWLTPNDLVAAVMHSYDEKSPRLHKCAVIDDMGRERNAHDFGEALCIALERDEHTLVITTNLTREQLRERYDHRLIDRLNDTAFAVDLPGGSLRRQDGGF